MLEGGHEFDGRPLVPFDTRGMRDGRPADPRAGDPLGRDRRGLLAAERLVRGRSRRPSSARSVPTSRSPSPTGSGRIGLLERENAALLNACLIELARHDHARLHARPCAASGIAAPLYLTQNDGTVMLAEVAEAYPVYSFASGPTNSMRGAAFLSKRDEALVIDVGGTTTDIGSLRHGFPREANNVVEIGGVRTLFRMPDLLSLGLGGGTIVSTAGVQRGPLTIGPASVGLSPHRAGARVRRRRPHRHRRRGRRRPHRPRRPRARGSAARRPGERGPRAASAP